MATYTDPTIIQLGDKPKIHTGSILALIAGVISLVGAGAFLLVTAQVKANTADITKKADQAQTRLDQLSSVAKELTELDVMAKNLQSVFTTQKKWDATLGTVEQRLYRNMVVTSMTFNEAGELVFTGYTRDYTDYAKIFRSLTDTNGRLYFSSVRPGSVAKVKATPAAPGAVASVIPPNSINFSFSVVLQPTILNAKSVLSLAELRKAAGLGLE